MPNIELRGFPQKEADPLRARIMTALVDKPYEQEYVISVIPCEVTDYRDRPQPFIRLVTTEHAHNAEIIEILRGLGVDVEYAPLIGFYPKK